jgi:TetR/AcrR family transcriptional repressor of nem operon
VEQSAAVFNRHGYSGTSMSALMAATGLEKGGLYRHFENCTTSLERLLLLVRNFVEPLPRAIPGGCPLLNTAIENDDGNPVLREKARGALDEWRSVIAEIVCQGMRGGELRNDVDPIAVATIVISSLEGAIMFSRLENTREALFMVGKHLEGYLRSLSRPE